MVYNVQNQSGGQVYVIEASSAENATREFVRAIYKFGVEGSLRIEELGEESWAAYDDTGLLGEYIVEAG